MNICQCFNTNSRGSGGQFVIRDTQQVVLGIAGDMAKASCGFGITLFSPV